MTKIVFFMREAESFIAAIVTTELDLQGFVRRYTLEQSPPMAEDTLFLSPLLRHSSPVEAPLFQGHSPT